MRPASSYMGVVQDVRGRGLGLWVHRRGFRMIREQGGTLHHGGTATDNLAMIRLFAPHGCEEVERMLELEWRSTADRRRETGGGVR